MDTHDTCGITHDQPMQEGVVLTIEPGLYIPDDRDAFGPFAGIGVRAWLCFHTFQIAAWQSRCTASLQWCSAHDNTGIGIDMRCHS